MCVLNENILLVVAARGGLWMTVEGPLPWVPLEVVYSTP